MRRIVHISDCYLPRLGGIEVQVRQLAMRQAEAGHDVHVVTATPGHGAVRSGVEELDGVHVHRIAARVPFELPVHPRTGHHVAAVLRDLADESLVVHAHAGVVSPFAWSGVRAATVGRVPTLVTVHSVWGPVAQPGFRALDAAVRWSRQGIQLGAVSSVAAARIRAAVGPGVPVLVTPNGVDPERWRIDHRERDCTDVHAVAVMRLAPRKRALPLMRMIGEAVAALPPGVGLRLTVAGDGPERARVERHVREHRLPVQLAGRLSHDRIRDLYADCDLFIQPSVKESFGLAALEARTAGLPVIARSQTGITEFVRDGVEGLLAGSDDEMVSALVRLSADAPLRARIAAHNRSVPPDQTWPNVLADVDRAYDAARGRVRGGHDQRPDPLA